MMSKFSFMMVGQIRYLMAFMVLLSIAITLVFISFVWDVFTPSTLIQNALFTMGAVLGGLVMYFTLNLFFMTLLMLFFLFMLRKKMKKVFKKMAEKY